MQNLSLVVCELRVVDTAQGRESIAVYSTRMLTEYLRNYPFK